jgi:branched-chain amino acid transport system ATP-binding protein
VEDAVLEVRGLTKRFGGVAAVNNVSFSLGGAGQKGEIVGLIGPNGAGKTTLINVITGVHGASSGQVMFEGRDVTRQRPFQSARGGLARTFQIVQPFPEMTVLENVAAGALFAGGAPTRREADRVALEHLEFVGLAHEAKRPAASLTLPSRKRLELAKSLAMKPRLLMLDEVNAGLNTGEIDRALELMRAIAARGITIMIVEHLMKVVFSLCQRVLVLHHGELIAEGAPREVAGDARVVEAYLGHKFAARLAAMDGGNARG